MLHDKPGNVVIMTGRNRPKIDRIQASVGAGMNVLADKPWIIASADMPKLQLVLDQAEKSGVVAYDIMTERYEITSILQRDLVNNSAIFGKLVVRHRCRACYSGEEHSSSDEAGGRRAHPAASLVLRCRRIWRRPGGCRYARRRPCPMDGIPGSEARLQVRRANAGRRHWPTNIPKVRFSAGHRRVRFSGIAGRARKDGKLEYIATTRSTTHSAART